MLRKKRSFFEKLTGSINTEDEMFFSNTAPGRDAVQRGQAQPERHEEREEGPEAELTVDVYQTPDDIIVETFVAGIDPQSLDVSISRDMVTISGSRERMNRTVEGDFFHQELYWGRFSRTVLLPEEVEVEDAQAVEKHGFLTIRLPKIDKKKKAKLVVKSE